MILLINTITQFTEQLKSNQLTFRSDSYAEYSEEFNEKEPKLKVGDRVRISKYKNIFAKGHTQNW